MRATTGFFAPAKINLALHVTGRRDDGYHLLETIAVFADAGDRIEARAAQTDTFEIAGPEAGALAGEDPASNLVVRARDAVRAELAVRGIDAPPVALALDKALPAGSGIGGGSADAAATVRALLDHWNGANAARTVFSNAASLGADVPMCLASRPLLAGGIGEKLTFLANVPAFALVLANPRRHVSTPAVFKALAKKDNAPISIREAATLSSPADWARWLGEDCRNDLQPPSIGLTPEIGDCLTAIDETRPLLARMSGSGATCFGLYGDMDAARDAATRLLKAHPDWWITATRTGPSPRTSPPPEEDI